VSPTSQYNPSVSKSRPSMSSATPQIACEAEDEPGDDSFLDPASVFGLETLYASELD